MSTSRFRQALVPSFEGDMASLTPSLIRDASAAIDHVARFDPNFLQC